MVPTESLVWDVSRWNQGKWSDGVLFEKLKQDLDALNKSKANNARDVLIAEVAIVSGFTLLTADRDLSAVVKNHGARLRSSRPKPLVPGTAGKLRLPVPSG